MKLLMNSCWQAWRQAGRCRRGRPDGSLNVSSRHALPLLACLILMSVMSGLASAQTPLVTNSVVRFRTSAGDLEVELYDEAKPVTSANFIKYVESGAYQNLILHRLVPGMVLQGGGYRSPYRTAANIFDSYFPVQTFGTITNEFGVGPLLSNTNGTLAMAKQANNTNSASSQWFFNLTDNSTNMDVDNGGFTVFGRVTRGTNVLDYFRGRSPTNGIVDLRFFYGLGAGAFADLPVRFAGFRLPQFNELEYVDVSIVRTPAKPAITLSSPAVGVVFTNAAVTFRGTAADRSIVTKVLVQLNGQPPLEASGTTTWSADLTLVPGTNTVRVTSFNRFGTESKAIVRTWFYSVLWPITITTNGSGSITPALGGKGLQIGRGYQLKASAGPGFVFSNWTGSVTSPAPTLNFLMLSNYALHGNFIPNPFLPVKGPYSGLFLEKTNNPAHQRSGFVTIVLTGSGTFTGKLLLDGDALPVSGKFGLDGSFQQYIFRTGKSVLLVQLQLGLGGAADQITGTVLSSGWQAELAADRATFGALTNPASVFRGRYHLAAPPATNNVASPGGYGIASLTIDTGGLGQLSGTLADGTVVVQAWPLSKTGRWPFYAALYSGKGSAFGWLQLTNEAGVLRPVGELKWTKVALPGRYYPAGFTNQVALSGSPFSSPAKGQRVLALTNAIFTVSAGNFVMETNSTLTISTNNEVLVTSTNLAKLMIALSPATGLVNGAFTHPVTRRSTPFKAIILQQEHKAFGWFLGTNQSGGLSITGE